MSVFDGMSSVLSGLLGDVIEVTSINGDRRQIQAVFRREPFDKLDIEGVTVVDYVPLISFDKRLADGIGEVFEIEAPDGCRYRSTQSPLPATSPAVDGEVTYRLAKVGNGTSN